MKHVLDNTLNGFAIGIIGPIFGTLIIFKSQFAKFDLGEFIVKMEHPDLLSGVLALATILNLLLFFLFLWANMNKASQGVVGATIIYGLIIIYLKMFA